MYTILRNQDRFGPYPADQVRAYLASGHLVPTDLVSSSDPPHWEPLRDVFLQPPPPPPPSVIVDRTGGAPQFGYAAVPALSREPEPVRPESGSPKPVGALNKLALCCLGVIYGSWFLFPFLSFGLGPFQLANATFWDVLGLSSSGGWRFLGLVAIASPLAALKSRRFLVRCLYLLPLVHFGLTFLLVMAEIGDAARSLHEASQDSPFLGTIAEAGLGAAIRSASVDFGGYALVVSALVLATQVFARQAR